MQGNESQLNGWKAIARHFGRDRTTVMRWARERNLPVHGLPGGKTRSVFALASELDRWAHSAAGSVSAMPCSQPARMRTENGDTGRVRSAIFAVAAALLPAAALFLAAPARQPPSSDTALPHNPAVAAVYVRARDEWASRSATGLARSIVGFRDTIRREPGFAPAYAALAEAYLLESEDGSLPDSAAYADAEQLASQALRLTPGLAAAYRVQGFVAYWQRHDASSADALFRRALTLAPADEQTHFWYANILADMGDDTRAMREFDEARLLNPGSADIAADYAWALWAAGSTQEASEQLQALVMQHPENAEALDCLAAIRLVDGNVEGYVVAMRKLASLRKDDRLRTRAEAAASAWTRGGKPAVEARLLAFELDEQKASAYPDHAAAAFLASLMGDRQRLAAILQLAAQDREHWGSAGYVRRIIARWRDDSTIRPLIEQRRIMATDTSLHA